MSESEREAGIHWSVCVQEAAKYASGLPAGEVPSSPEEHGEGIVKIAAEIWAWRGMCFPNGQLATPQRQEEPPPPDEWPDDREAYNAGPATQGPVGQTPPTCLCGAEKVYTRTDTYTAYFCPNQVKSRDPVVQAEQKLKHPPTWL